MDQSTRLALVEEDSEALFTNASLFGGQWPITCYWSPAQ